MLFLKEKYLSWLFRKNYIEKKFNFIFHFFYELLFSLELPRVAGLLKASCFGEMNLFNRGNARDADAAPSE